MREKETVDPHLVFSIIVTVHFVDSFCTQCSFLGLFGIVLYIQCGLRFVFCYFMFDESLRGGVFFFSSFSSHSIGNFMLFFAN